MSEERLSRGRLFWEVVVRVEFGPAGAHPALAADDARRRKEEERRGDQEEDPKTSEDTNHLGPMPDDGGSRVAQLVFARPFVIVTQEEVIIKGSETVPTEDMFTPFAHHLSTTFIFLNGDSAHGATFDEI